MKYTNTTKNGIYVSIPSGHVYVPAGGTVENPIHFSTPGLRIELEKKPKKLFKKPKELFKKPKEQPVTQKENDVRTRN